MKLNPRSKSSGQVVVLVIIVLVLLGVAYLWLNSQKQASAREGTVFANEAIQRIAIQHDINFFNSRLSPQARTNFAPSAALYRTSDLQMKYMPFGLASVLVGLIAAVVLYAGWCGGTSSAVKGLQFGLILGVFVACIHPISNLITMNMDTKLGLEITVSTAIGWVLAGLVIGLVYKPLAPLAACGGTAFS